MSLRNKILINISIIVTFFLPLSFADEGFHWEFSGWQGGGCFSNIEFDPHFRGRVYLTSDVAGIWRSDDLGENWQFITHGLQNLNIAALKVAPSDSSILYAATQNGLYLSRDAGASWQMTNNPDQQLKFLRPQSYKPLAVSPLDPKNICVGTAKGKVLCSQNWGQDWVDLDPKRMSLSSEKPIAAVLYTSDSKNLWIGGADGILAYDFATKTVKSYHESGNNVADMDILWDNKTIYAAINGKYGVYYDGKKIEYPTVENGKGEIFRIAIKTAIESDKERILVFSALNQGWNGRILASSDNGTSWSNVVEKINPDKNADPTWAWANPKGKIASLKIDPFDPKVMFFTNWWGVFRSDDGGQTWNEKIRGAPNTVGSDIKVTKDFVWVATMDNGLLKSADGGQNYETVFPFDRYDNAKSGHVWRVIIPEDNTVVATSSPWNERVNQVIVSHDGGKNFKIVRDGLPQGRPKKNTMWGEGYPRALAFDPKNSQRLYLGIDGDDGGGLFISDDGGLTWARSEGQPGALRIYNALAVDPTDSNRLFWGACGKGGGVYVSSDGGKTWRRTLKEMEWVFDLTITPQGVIYAAGDSSGPKVFISHDHGANWKKISFENKGAAEALAIDPVDEKRVAVSTLLWSPGAAGKIYLSTDAGLNWKEVTGDLPPGAGAAAMSFSPDGKYLYLTRYAGSAYRLEIK
jgi:photosystem II stability/assembly factor-like uncharacterized protein